MGARDRPPDIVITVRERAGHPFIDYEQEARVVFANHPNKENLLQNCHEDMIENFAELMKMGPHPLLDRQIKDAEHPESIHWIHCLIKAEYTEEWVLFLMRHDNVYNRGFINRHNAFECTERKVSEPMGAGDNLMEMTGAAEDTTESIAGMPTERTQLLPPEYNCVLLDWDVAYTDLFGIKETKELELEIQKMADDPTFVFKALCYLSNFNHTDESAKHKEAKKYLGGITFLLCEFLRMNLRKLAPHCSLLGCARQWGEICLQLLKWRDNDCTDWIMDRQVEVKTKLMRALELLDIHTVADALRIVVLVLNRSVEYYANIDMYKPKRTKVISESGGKGSKKSTQPKRGRGKDNQVHDTRKEKQSDGRTNTRNTGAQCDSVCFKNRSNSLPCGRRRVQVLSVTANFEVEWLNFHDWHRPQAIYRKNLVRHHPIAEFPLIGPARPIGAYANLGLEYSPTKTKTKREYYKRANNCKTNQRGAIIEFWPVDCFNDEEPSIHTKEISGPWKDEKIIISYMLIPDTVEARIGLELLLTEDHVTYHVRGFMKAWNSSMGDYKAKLFSQQTVVAASGQWASLPLMVPLVCFPNTDDFQVKIVADIQVSTSLDSWDQCLVLSTMEPIILTQTRRRQELEIQGHKLAFTVNLTV